MPKTVAVIGFDGSSYLGWQIQKDFHPTVQELFNKALNKIYKKEVSSMASGRTDSGVHALSMHVGFDAPFNIPLDKLTNAINSNLPRDIRVHECYIPDENWHATVSAKSREYKYLFSNNKVITPFQERFIPNISYDLDIEKMKKACSLFVGEYDFFNFHCTGSETGSTIRSISKCELSFQEIEMHGVFPSHYVITIEGSGFLKQMVRLIVGAIWNVGRGKLSLDSLQQSLSREVDGKVGAVAPAQGLFKSNVQY